MCTSWKRHLIFKSKLQFSEHLFPIAYNFTYTYVYKIFIYDLWPQANLNFIAKIHHADAAAILINILNFSSSCRYIGTLWTREMLNVHSAEWFTFHSKILLLINITYLYMYFSCDLNPELNESRIQFVCTWAENYMYNFFFIAW